MLGKERLVPIILKTLAKYTKDGPVPVWAITIKINSEIRRKYPNESVSESTVRKYLNQLSEEGLVEVYPWGQRTKFYGVK